LFLTALVLAAGMPAEAQWSQWGGPSRDFQLAPAALGSAADAPKLLWSRELGAGESAVTVHDGVLYTMYRDGDEEAVVALDPSDGKTVWEHRYAAPIPEGFFTMYGDGPHAAPLVVGDRVFTLGIAGHLHALDRKTGKPLWSHDLIGEYGGKPAVCGYGGSPLPYGKTIIVPVGGEGHAVMAFAQSDGSVAWRSGDFAAGYASPILIEVGGQEQVVAFMGEVVIGLDPKKGALYWQHPHKTQYGVNASTPIFGDDGVLFISSAYDNGSRGLKLTRSGGKTEVEELWHQKKMQVHFGTAVRIGGHVYATSGSFGPSFLTAVDVQSGELVWQERDVAAKGSLLAAGDRVLIVDEKGKLVLARVAPDGVEVLAEHSLVDGKIWGPPTLVGSILYVRDTKGVRAFSLGS
jgi:outer membrane protein assembly factor BamB